MAREQGVELVDEFEALLRKELAVVPSTGFLPRVRHRVATEEKGAWRWTWRLLVPAGVLAAAAALAVTVGGLTDRVAAPPRPSRPVLQTGAPIAPVTQVPAETPVGGVGAVGFAASVPAVALVTESRVVVDERQRAALLTMLRMVQQGRLTEERFANTVTPSLQPIKERVRRIGVDELAVSPIETGGVLQIGTEK